MLNNVDVVVAVVNNNQIAVILIWTDYESARGCYCRTRVAACWRPLRRPADAVVTYQRTDVAKPHLRKLRIRSVIKFICVDGLT